MMRKWTACLLLIAVLTAWPGSGVVAQAAPVVGHPELVQANDKNDKNPAPIGCQPGRCGSSAPQASPGQKDKQGSSGQKGKQAPAPSAYSQQVAGVLIGQFDRTMGEIDAAPANPSPTDVKGLTYRRRILELRLLMDTNSFMYNHDQMKVFRDAVDAAYQAIGDYQDVSVIEKDLDGFHVNADVVNARLNQMNDSLGPLRDDTWRNQIRSFFSDPRPNVRSSPGSPRLWDEAGTRASDSYDQVGNVALLQAAVFRHLAGQDIGVTNIFDPDQIVQFHAIRKDVRSMLVLMSMFPETNDAIQDVYKTLDDLNDHYDDTHDAYNAWIIAQQEGLDPSTIAVKLSHEFDQAQDAKNAVISSDALNVAAQHLEALRDAHRV
jgi:hypothetical protein